MNKTIISDTSCLIALSNSGNLNVLKKLYKEVVLSEEVKAEFKDILPEWIKILQVQNKQKQSEIEKILDKGEASSIALALEHKNSILIIDELKGRNVAKSYKLDIIGTIGIIVLAYKKGIVKNFDDTLNSLIRSGFRLSKDLLSKLINEYGKK